MAHPLEPQPEGAQTGRARAGGGPALASDVDQAASASRAEAAERQAEAWPSYIPRIRTFESLRFRDFRLLWLGQGGSSMGQWMDQVARGWLVYDMTGSAVDLGIVMAMRGVPMILFSLIAGVVADRYTRKAQLVLSQAVNVVINLIIATLILFGRVEVWHIFLGAFLSGTVQSFQQPARQSLIAELVGVKHLANALALHSAIFNLMRCLGPAIAGATIALVGVGGSYYIQAGLYTWATLWVIQMRVPGEPSWMDLVRLKRIEFTRMEADGGEREESETAEEQQAVGHGNGHGRRSANDSFFGSLAEGFQYLFRNPLILSLMFLALAPVLLGMPFISLLPIFAKDVLHGGSVEQGLLLGAVGFGSLFGALGIATFSSFRRKGILLLVGATMFGIALIAFSQATWMPISLACLFAVGVAQTSYNSQNQTIIQIMTPARLRGRIMSIYMLDRGLMPLGAMMAGILASMLGGPWAVAIMGASCTVLALAIAVMRPEIRKIDI